MSRKVTWISDEGVDDDLDQRNSTGRPGDPQKIRVLWRCSVFPPREAIGARGEQEDISRRGEVISLALDESLRQLALTRKVAIGEREREERRVPCCWIG
jgi:hypothetical protein